MATASPTSTSEGEGLPLLHPLIQDWVTSRWGGLRPVQQGAIPPILAGRDTLVVAPTASGKTEAAFLPICSLLLSRPPVHGVAVLYLSPLKALIDDICERLESLCYPLGIEVTPWHGDVASSRKSRLRQSPSGILLTTPESLEAMLFLRGPETAAMLGGLVRVVIDEVHGFMGTERGAQVRSLLRRVEDATGRAVPRVGLSATIGDVSAAAEFLRPGAGDAVAVVRSLEPQRVRVQVRGYRAPTRSDDGGEEGLDPEEAIAHDLFRLRGSDNLVFVNSRAAVESYADLLADLSERAGVPSEFWPHHGNLAPGVRRHTEGSLKGHGPATAVCTSTLELGIDIGTAKSVAQVGPPPSVASLRQRLGRSGRRGEPATIRIHVAEGDALDPVGQLRPALVQAVAAVRLLQQGWYEPVPPGVRHLSTLIQQVLSLVAERSGAHPREVYRVLCAGPAAAFAAVERSEFARILRTMEDRGLVERAEDGTLLLGALGEKVVGRYSFYAAFQTPVEYRVLGAGRTLGTLPVVRPLDVGHPMLFAGRRWVVSAVHEGRRLVEVEPSPSALAPEFGGLGMSVAGRVREEMLVIYRGEDVPSYLDPSARDLLAAGREAFRRLGLVETSLISWGGGTFAFCWGGDPALDALALALRARGVQAFPYGPALRAPTTPPGELRAHLVALAASSAPEGPDLARGIATAAQEKHDRYLPRELLLGEHAARALDVEGAWRVIGRLIEEEAELHDRAG
jgi:ATP-dependent helicase Lhr and Lhr-like helicase